MKKIAVIILNWNGESLLREYLPEVLANTDPDLADVIVADNGSTDGSVAYCRALGVRLLEFPENYGFAGGYNRALSEVDNPYVILLNSDVSPAQNWIAPLLDYMERNPDVGACQPKILSRKAPERFEYAGAAGGYIDCNGYPYCRGRVFDTVEYDCGQYDDVADIDWASGAALMVRRDLYMLAGGLDAAFFAHMEEIDLCWRIRLRGARVAVVPSSSVYHLGGGSLPADNPRKTYLNFRNNLLMLHKNLPDGVRGRRLFRRMLLDGVAWLRFVISCDMANASAILRAHCDFRRMKCAYTEHPDVNLLVGRPNVLFDYYIRRRRLFSELV